VDELKERLTELEIRFTHQAQMIEELNGEVLECHRRLTRLERENHQLRETLGRLAPELPESPDE
jgi:SlyX protein